MSRLRQLLIAVFFVIGISCSKTNIDCKNKSPVATYEMAYQMAKFHNDIFFSDIKFRIQENIELKKRLKSEELILIESFSDDLDKYIDNHTGSDYKPLEKKIEYYIENLIDITGNEEMISALTNKIGFKENLVGLENKPAMHEYYLSKLKLDNQLIVFNVIQYLYRDINIH